MYAIRSYYVVMIPQMALGGAMFSFDKLNRAIGSVEGVPPVCELMATRWVYEGLMVRQFKDNKFEKEFYEIERLVSVITSYSIHYTKLYENWIAQGKDIISDILRMQNDLDELSIKTLVELIKYINVLQGALYIYNEETKVLKNTATYAYNRQKYQEQEFHIGEGLVGQCAYEMDTIYRREIPEGYTTVKSGILGDKKPTSLLLVPLITDEKLRITSYNVCYTKLLRL